MPFTLAHPAAVLPFRSRYASFSALVVGSMAPDFEYLLRARVVSTVSHTLIGVFLFCLPIGVIVFIVAKVLRQGFVALLPRYIRTRIPTSARQHNWLAIVASLLVGAATHVVWDSFTHRNGWAVTRLGLDSSYTTLQHASTAIGLVVLAVFAVRHFGRIQPHSDAFIELRRTRIAFALTACAAMALVAWLAAIRGWGLGTSVVRVIDASIAITALYSVISVPLW